MSQERSGVWPILTLLLAIALAALPAVLMTVALPLISQDLGLPIGQVSRLGAAFLFGLVILLLPSAALGEAIGHRAVMLGGTVVLALVSCCAGLAASLMPMLLLRAGQGMATAAVLAPALAMLRASVPPQRLGLAVGLSVLAPAVTVLLGPMMAGSIIHAGGYALVFAPVAALALPVLVLGLAVLPAAHGEARQGFDFLGSLLAVLALAALFLGGQAVAELPWLAKPLFLLAAAALILLLMVEWRRPAPLLPLDLLARPRVAVAALARFCMLAAVFAAMMAAIPLLLQLGWRSPAAIGLAIFGWHTAAALAGLLAGWLLPSGPLLAASGALLMGAALLGIGATTPSQPPPMAMLAMAAGGFGLGLFETANGRALLGAGPPHRAGAAAGLLTLAAALGSAAGPFYVALMPWALNIAATPGNWLQAAAGAAAAAAVLSVFGPKA